MNVFNRRYECYRFEKVANERKFTRRGLKVPWFILYPCVAWQSVIKLIHGTNNCRHRLFFFARDTPNIHTIQNANKYISDKKNGNDDER